MNDFNPNFPSPLQYEILYKRYLQSPADALLKVAELKWGERVLDIGAGNLRQSYAALKMGAAKPVVAVDSSWEDNKPVGPIGIILYDRHIEELFSDWMKCGYPEKFDVVACQQGINYWLREETIKHVSQILSPNGRFVFNTFNDKPSEKPTFRQYTIGTTAYLESYHCIGSTVYHCQMAEGVIPHFHSFPWISPTDIFLLLNPLFSTIQIIKRGHSTTYACSDTRKL